MQFLEPLVTPMTAFLNFLYQATVTLKIPSYALSIIFFTITIKLILYPLNAKSMRSMKLMQELQPKIKEIQQKQKDPQKSQAAIMELYKQYGANPLSGCLPMLIQMPILFALYQALRNFKFVKMEHAKFLWIGSDLSVKLSHATLKTADPIFILPVLAGISTFFLQKMSSNSQDSTQRTMLYMMPIFFTYISTKMPAGLVLYWVVFNILGIAQQYIINKKPLAITVKEESGKNEGNRKNRKNA